MRKLQHRKPLTTILNPSPTPQHVLRTVHSSHAATRTREPPFDRPDHPTPRFFDICRRCYEKTHRVRNALPASGYLLVHPILRVARLHGLWTTPGDYAHVHARPQHLPDRWFPERSSETRLESWAMLDGISPANVTSHRTHDKHLPSDTVHVTVTRSTHSVSTPLQPFVFHERLCMASAAALTVLPRPTIPPQATCQNHLLPCRHPLTRTRTGVQGSPLQTQHPP